MAMQFGPLLPSRITPVFDDSVADLQHPLGPLSLKEVQALVLEGNSTSKSYLLKPIAETSSTQPLNVTYKIEEVGDNSVYICIDEQEDRRWVNCVEAINNNAALIVAGDKVLLDILAARESRTGVIYCENTRNHKLLAVDRAVRPLVRAHRNRFKNIPCIAISGTAGKTTTTDLTRSILGSRVNLCSTEKSQNNIKRTTRHLLSMNSEHECGLFEFGTNGIGQISIMSSMVMPNISYTTSIGLDHADKISSIDEMLACETEQYEWMAEHSVRPPIYLANIDDPYLKKFFEDKKELLLASGLIFTVSTELHRAADFQLKNYTEYFNGNHFFTTLSVATPYGLVNASVPLIGQHNRANICGAIAVCLVSGCVTIEDVVHGLENPQFTGRRAEFTATKRGFFIFDETFHSSPFGLEKSINMAVSTREISGGKIKHICAVLGDMGELGGDAAAQHVLMGEKAKLLGIDSLYAFGNFAKNFVEGFGTSNALSFPSKEKLIGQLKAQLRHMDQDELAKTLFLVKGGYATKSREIVTELKAMGAYQ